MNIGNSLLYKEDFAWMKKQTLLRLNWVFHCIVLLMNKNKNRQCWMLWKQEYLSIVCKFVTEWKERFKWAIWKIIWNSKQFFNRKNTIKIWLSAKTQYLSAFSRKQTHQFTTYLLLTNEPWYASFPRYAKIWYSTSVLKQEKIE